jgi:hypothetical protein
MAIRERLIYAIEVVTDRAQAGFKGFRQSVSDAEGSVNKFKAGASSAMSTVQANAGNLALAGGAALVAFGTKAVGAFQETALEAGKLADATGLTVEQASRLREVAGDIGVSGETVTAVVAKMNKAIGDGAPIVEELGIELQKTADGTVDVNATLLDTIDRINAIEDPTRRAAAAQQIFGRGYAQAAELIFDSADNVQRKLAEVSEQKVINEDELEKARQFRESMDNLKDAGEDVALVTGEVLVPILGDLAEGLLLARDAADQLNAILPESFGLGDLGLGRGALPLFIERMQDVKDAFTGGADGANLFDAAIQNMLPEINEAGNIVGELSEEVEGLGPRWAASTIPLEAASGAFAEMQSEADRAAAAVEDAGDAADDAAGKFNPLAEAVAAVGEALDEAFSDFEEDINALDLLADIEEQFEEVADTSEKSARDQQRDFRQLQSLIADYLQDLDGIPPDKKTEILAQIRSGDIETLRATLDELTKDRFISIGVTSPTQPGFESIGGTFSPTQATPIFNGVQSAIPSGPMTVINNYPIGSTPTTVYQDQQTYLRWNGPR